MKFLIVLSFFALSAAQARTLECTIELKETAAARADLIESGKIIESKVFHQIDISQSPTNTSQWSTEIQTKLYSAKQVSLSKPVTVSEGQSIIVSVDTLRFGPVSHFLSLKGDQLSWELKGDRVNTSTKLTFDGQPISSGGTSPLTYTINYALNLRDDPAHTFEYQGKNYPVTVGQGTSFHLSCFQNLYK